MTIHTHDDAYEPAHTASQTAHALDELQLYGYRPFDEPDPRPMPDADRLRGAVADIFDALIATMADTSLDADLNEILWSTVNTFHRAAERIETQLRRYMNRLKSRTNGIAVAAPELEAIVRPLEDGNVTLQESVDLWERGEKLAAHCDLLLGQVESRIEAAKAQVEDPT